MIALADILPNRATLHADAEAATVVRDIPTRRAVCLLLDAEDRAVQVLAWANPRVGMKRRLAEPVEGEKTRRVNYGELVRSVRWQAVDSEFESDVVHAAVVRAAFPLRAGELLKFAQPWFLHVDPAAEFPRWTRIERPASGRDRSPSGLPADPGRDRSPSGLSHAEDGGFGETALPLSEPGGVGETALPVAVTIGPLPDRSTANRVIEVLEDLFDLCRYYHILLEAPRGKACAYKDMGRCPAPCDGSVPMEDYRRRIAESAGVLRRPGGARELVADIEREMQLAAEQLRFEAAKTLKARLEKARELTRPELAWVGSVEYMAIVTVQPGLAAGDAKLFLIGLGGVVEVGTFGEGKFGEAVEAARRLAGVAFVAQPSRLWPENQSRDGCATNAVFDPLAFGPVMRHLFGDAKRRSRFCRVEDLNEGWLAERMREWKVVPTPSSAGPGDVPQTGE